MPIQENKHGKTPAEKAQEIQELMKDLSPAERSAVDAIFKDLQENKENTLLDTLKDAEYLRPMVDIETFVKDPYYLGNTCGDTLYPVLMEDLKEVDKGGYEEAIWSGSTRTGKCLSGFNEIYDAKNGLRKEAQDLGAYKVTSIDENTGKIYVNEANSRYSGEKECVKITNSAGDYISITKDHKIFTPKGWIEAGNLKLNDYISSPRFYPEPEKYLEIDDDELKLISYMLSDGGLAGHSCNFTNGSTQINNEFKYLVESLGETTSWGSPQVSPRKDQSSKNATQSNVRGISNIIKKWGIRGHARDKRIPAEFYGLNKRQIGLFLNRFWACDGSIVLSHRKNKKNATPSVEVCLASEMMVKDIKFLLGRLGIYSRTHFKNKKYTYKGEIKCKPAWDVIISNKENIEKFLDAVGPVLDKEDKCQIIKNFYANNTYSKIDCSNTDTIPLKKNEYSKLKKEIFESSGNYLAARKSKFKKNYKANYTRSRFERLCEELEYKGTFSWLAKNDLYWEKIIKIEDAGVQDVYDLSVNENHNFVANNIVIHNSFVASIVVCRFLYKLSCMRDPQKSLGIASGSKIACIVLSANEMLAREVAFENIVTKISASPYFQENFKFKDNKGELIFPNNIVVMAKATTDKSALGFNIALFLIDEAAFFGNSKKMDPKFGHVDNAELIYRSLKTRMKNTFKQSKFKGIGIISSSLSTVDNFMSRHLTAMRKNSNVFIKQRNAWTILPELYKNSDKFFVLVGNELMASRILQASEVEEVSKILPDGAFIEEVPEEFLQDFTDNLESSIRDLLGASTTSISPFLQQRDRIIDAYDVSKWPSCIKTTTGGPALAHNFTVAEWDPSKPGGFVWDRMVSKKLVREYDGSYIEAYKPLINPQAARAIHLDPSLKLDSTGVCFLAGTKILMADLTEKNIEDVKVGDRVIDAFGKIEKITKTFKKQYNGEIKHLNVLGGRELYVTPEHPLLGIKSNNLKKYKSVISDEKQRGTKPETVEKYRKNSLPIFIESKNYTSSDQIASPIINFDTEDFDNFKTMFYKNGLIPITPELGTVVGYYLAEGSLFRNSNETTKLFPQFTFSWNGLDARHIIKLKKAIESVLSYRDFGCLYDNYKKYKGEQSSVTVRILDRDLGAFLKMFCGEYSDKKFIHPFLLYGTNSEFRDNLLKAYWEGDGTINSFRRNGRGGTKSAPTWEVTVKTASADIASAMTFLCQSKNITIRTYFTEFDYTNGKHEREKPIYKLCISGYHQLLKIFSKEFLDLQEEKVYPQTDSIRGFVNGDHAFYPVQKVENILYTGFVYNLEVSGSHTYVANKLSVHNCMAHIAGFKDVQRRDENGKTYSEKAPIYVVDLILRINPPQGGEIEFAKIRDLVYQLSNHGYNISSVSMDKYIRDGLQPFQQKGFSTEWISVDETTEPYDVMKSALYEGRLFFYKYDRLIQELQLLEKVYINNRVKIDHPPTFGKDLADALAGVIFALSKKQNFSPMPMIRSGNNEGGDVWMQEQLQAAFAGKEQASMKQDAVSSLFTGHDWGNQNNDSTWSDLY